jgi:hypothetical protein
MKIVGKIQLHCNQRKRQWEGKVDGRGKIIYKSIHAKIEKSQKEFTNSYVQK